MQHESPPTPQLCIYDRRRSDIKTRRRLRKDLEDENYYEESSHSSLESADAQARGGLYLKGKYAFGESQAKLPHLPIENLLEMGSDAEKTTQRKPKAKAPVISILVSPGTFKKYLKDSPLKKVYSQRDNDRQKQPDVQAYKPPASLGKSNITQILDKVDHLKTRHSKIERSIDRIRNFIGTSVKPQISPKVNRELTKVIQSVRKVELGELGIVSAAWVDRWSKGQPKAVIAVDSKLLAAIKKSSVHRFELHDHHAYTLYTIDKRACLASGFGRLRNSHGRLLYEGQVAGGKLHGEGRLLNTRLNIESFLA